jgi:ferredoxin, 2Fe-2S
MVSYQRLECRPTGVLVRAGAVRRQQRRVLVPKLTFLSADGTVRAVDGSVGESVMLAAVQNGVPGIIAECGGNASCGTCHVWVTEDYVDAVGEPNDTEEDMLDLAVSDRRPGSRLSCQIRVTEDLDGLTVEIPPVQP